MLEKTVYLSLGSNLGDRQAALKEAIAALPHGGVTVINRSSIYETEPQDLRDQPWFLNQVVEVRTRLFPRQLLASTQRIERQLGRIRSRVSRGPRVIDIDVLLFGLAIVSTPDLEIPHPRMLDRRFVLEPLVEIAPTLRHPITREPLAHALGKVRNQRAAVFAAARMGKT
jgi:2-amino-4-hydroxy-6-hydroxymethyldihydropteridine diphosphokinase